MPPRIRNESGESKKIVSCGICGLECRRDNMPRHFQLKHNGQKYCESGQQSINKFFKVPQTVPSDDDSMGDRNEVFNEASEDELLIDSSIDGTLSQDNYKEIMNKLEQMHIDILNKHDKEGIKDYDKEKISDDEDMIKYFKIEQTRNIPDLCITANMTMYRKDKKLTCDICDEDSASDIRQGGEFKYDFETEGTDFTEGNLPRSFRTLKTTVLRHVKNSNTHKLAIRNKLQKEKDDKNENVYNEKVGMKLGTMIYRNVKERNSYIKYERDVANAAALGEEVGNINHSTDFAKNVVEAMGEELKIETIKYFNTKLECTDEFPPMSFAADKMTMKHKTGHIMAGITPDIGQPLSEPLMKPVVLAMLITRLHDGVGIATQMLNVMELYLWQVEEQLQSVNTDGQYIKLNVKNHIINLRRVLADKINWIIFSWDPAHRLNLASNDATKDNKDDSKKEGSLSDVINLVQKMNKHVKYGKHNIELEDELNALNITDKNKPLSFSDTRFPQYAYFVLRNFVNSYPALIQQLEYELSYSDNKSEEIKAILSEAKSVQFVVTLLGATDIFRRQQILSQQAQKLDQLISDLFGNIKLQLDKLKMINEHLKSNIHPDDWREDDIKEMDEHLLAETRSGLLEIVQTLTFKGIKLKRNDKLDIAVAIVELRNHLNRNIFALEERFKEDFDSEFVEEVKDSFDFNWMITLKEEVDENDKCIEEAFDEVNDHGNEALKFIMNRQSLDNPPTNEEMTKVIEEYKEVKMYAFKIIMGIEMDRMMRVIKEYAIEETAICLVCHRRVKMEKVLKHNKDIHKGELIEFCDKLIQYSSIKVIHGICKEEKLFQNKKKFLNLALKVFCKTPNESVVESIGSIAELHTQPQRNCNFKKFETELIVDWNGPKPSKAQDFIRRALDRHFGGRKNWRFRTGSSKYFVSKVVDRVNSEPSRLTFLE